MEKIVITSDSGIDPINEENMISGQIIRDGLDSYRDIVEITPSAILKQSKEGHKFKTASPILSDYQEKFEELLEDGNDVIHLSMSSGISEGSINSSNLIANMLNSEYENKVYVVDTLTGATGGTLISEIAESYKGEGMTTKEIVDELNRIKKNIHTSFYVPNPKGFIESGRDKSELCMKDKALLHGATLAKKAGIKFRVDFNDEGNLHTKSLIRTKNSIGMLKLLKTLVNDETIEQYDPNYIVIGNILEHDISMSELEEYIKQFNYFKHVINKNINGVVAAYGSEDLCGISLLKRP